MDSGLIKKHGFISVIIVLHSVNNCLIGLKFRFLFISRARIPSDDDGFILAFMLGFLLSSFSRTLYLFRSMVCLSNFLNFSMLFSYNVSLNSCNVSFSVYASSSMLFTIVYVKSDCIASDFILSSFTSSMNSWVYSLEYSLAYVLNWFQSFIVEILEFNFCISVFLPPQNETIIDIGSLSIVHN